MPSITVFFINLFVCFVSIVLHKHLSVYYRSFLCRTAHELDLWQMSMRAEVKSGHISQKGYRDSPVIILCPFTDYPIIPSLFCIQMAHIQHEVLENQKCDTLQFHGVAYYLITIASAVIFCYFNGTNLY